MLSRLIYAARIALTVALVAQLRWPASRFTARSDRRLFRRLGRSHHLAPGRYLDGVSAGAALDRAGGRDRRPGSLRSSSPSSSSTGPASAASSAPRRCCSRRDGYVAARARRRAAPLRDAVGEVLPNVVPLIVVLLSVEMGIAVMVEAILSFVGLSVSADAPTWGGMIAEGRAAHPSRLVGIGLPADRAVPHRARLQPVRRRLERRFDPVCAMTDSCSSRKPAVRALRGAAGRRAARCRSASKPGEVHGLVGESGAGKSDDRARHARRSCLRRS